MELWAPSPIPSIDYRIKSLIVVHVLHKFTRRGRSYAWFQTYLGSTEFLHCICIDILPFLAWFLVQEKHVFFGNGRRTPNPFISGHLQGLYIYNKKYIYIIRNGWPQGSLLKLRLYKLSFVVNFDTVHGATSPNNVFVANFHAPTSSHKIDLQSGSWRSVYSCNLTKYT